MDALCKLLYDSSEGKFSKTRSITILDCPGEIMAEANSWDLSRGRWKIYSLIDVIVTPDLLKRHRLRHRGSKKFHVPTINQASLTTTKLHNGDCTAG
jgi:hypothetical protein